MQQRCRWWIHAREYLSGVYSTSHHPDLCLVGHTDRFCWRFGMNSFRRKQGALAGMNCIQNGILDFGASLKAAPRSAVILNPQLLQSFFKAAISRKYISAAKSL